MTHWAKKLGLAAALVLALGISLPSAASAHDPYRHRTYDRYRPSYRSYERYRPSWSYTPYYRSDYGYRSNDGYGRRWYGNGSYNRYYPPIRSRSSRGYWHWHDGRSCDRDH